MAILAGCTLGLGVAAVCAVSLANTIHPTGIVVHHSALSLKDFSMLSQPTDVTQIDLLHSKRGFHVFYWGHVYHVAYHYIILPDGSIQSGRPERCVGAHASGNNQTLGICLVGNFSTVANPDGKLGNRVPTANQIRSLTSLIKRLSDSYQIPCDRIFRHQDLNPRTFCPGDQFPWRQLEIQIGCAETR